MPENDKDKEELANMIVEKFMKRIYQEFGQSFLNKLFWAGVIILLVIGWKLGVIKGLA